MAEDSDQINVSEFADMLIERFSTMNSNENEPQFRGRIKSTMISIAAHLKHLDQEIKALKAAQSQGVDGGLDDSAPAASGAAEGGGTDYSKPENSGNHAALTG